MLNRLSRISTLFGKSQMLMAQRHISEFLQHGKDNVLRISPSRIKKNPNPFNPNDVTFDQAVRFSFKDCVSKTINIDVPQAAIDKAVEELASGKLTVKLTQDDKVTKFLYGAEYGTYVITLRLDAEKKLEVVKIIENQAVLFLAKNPAPQLRKEGSSCARKKI